MDSDCFNAQLCGGAQHSDGDFAAIRDQETFHAHADKPTFRSSYSD
jgi:hypothetical protein